VPQLFYVPVFIGFAYFGIGFVSWMTASTILDRPERLGLGGGRRCLRRALHELPMIFNIFSIIPVSLFAITKIARGDLAVSVSAPSSGALTHDS
jgi:putative membrane protein